MIYVLIPVYNEEQNLAQLCADLRAVLPGRGRHYVFVDDCSTDRTVVLLKELLPRDQLEVIVKEKQGGPGDSFNRGFEWILQHWAERHARLMDGQAEPRHPELVSGSVRGSGSPDLIVTLEGDNTSDLGILPNMVAIAELGYKLVLASVYAQGGSFDKTTFFRRLTSSTANFVFRFFFGIRVQTLSSFYRVCHVELARQIRGRYGTIIREAGFISMLEILVKAIRLNAPMIEVPMKLMSQKRKGKSKMKKLKTMWDYLRFLMTFRSKPNPYGRQS